MQWAHEQLQWCLAAMTLGLVLRELLSEGIEGLGKSERSARKV